MTTEQDIQDVPTEAYEAPPTYLGPSVDTSLPKREVLTPLGTSTIRDADLERKGYRYSYSKPCQKRLVEIVYLKEDDTTGTVIADLESLFDIKLVTSADNKLCCRVTFKLLREVTSPVNLHCADVPVDSISSAKINSILKSLMDHFLEKVYGRAPKS